MKNRIPTYAKIMALLLICASCKEDEADTGFSDQPMAGKISDLAYTSTSGGGQAIDWVFDESRVDITIGGELVSEPCSYSYDGPVVSFIVLKEVGTYTLDEDWVSDASVGQYLVYLHPNGNSDPDDFIIVSDGAIEILSVTSESISGRVNARYDDQNFVNGSFTVNYCDG